MFLAATCVHAYEDKFRTASSAVFKVEDEHIEIVAGSVLDGQRGALIASDSEIKIFKKWERKGRY